MILCTKDETRTPTLFQSGYLGDPPPTGIAPAARVRLLSLDGAGGAPAANVCRADRRPRPTRSWRSRRSSRPRSNLDFRRRWRPLLPPLPVTLPSRSWQRRASSPGPGDRSPVRSARRPGCAGAAGRGARSRRHRSAAGRRWPAVRADDAGRGPARRAGHPMAARRGARVRDRARARRAGGVRGHPALRRRGHVRRNRTGSAGWSRWLAARGAAAAPSPGSRHAGAGVRRTVDRAGRRRLGALRESWRPHLPGDLAARPPCAR